MAGAMTGHGRVLVVDDDPEVLEALREILEDLGYEASTAASAEQAIAAMATVRPHVVFLDLRMPGISGLEALTYFRQHHRTLPVIVITGDPGTRARRKLAPPAPSTSSQTVRHGRTAEPRGAGHEGGATYVTLQARRAAALWTAQDPVERGRYPESALGDPADPRCGVIRQRP